MASASMVQQGPRGTPGMLTLAPEVWSGGEASMASDMFSFGGLALQALHPSQAEQWRAGPQWEEDGAACVEGAVLLLRRLLSREPAQRPSASQALADDMFAAMGVAEHKEAARQLAGLVEEQARFREEEAALAAVVQAQMKELTGQRLALDEEAARVTAKQRQHDEDLRKRREALEHRAKSVADKEAEVTRMIKSRSPPYWKNAGQGFRIVSNPSMVSRLQSWIRDSVYAGQHHHCGTAMRGATVTKVSRVENEGLWWQYGTKKEVLKLEQQAWRQQGITVPSLLHKTKQPALPSAELDSDLNELFLFHGTSHDTALTIAQHGFDERVANLGGLYGAGSYFADASCKSNQYAARSSTAQGEHVLLLCRVVMGWAFPTTDQHNSQRRPPPNPKADRNRPYDSVFAESGVARRRQQEHNEYVVFDRTQAYPEYIVYYKL